MTGDPLKRALEEISPKLDDDMTPILMSLLADEPVEDAWEALLKEVLDEA